jgi:O-methyltransferase involved in polyketide biosynthesis
MTIDSGVRSSSVRAAGITLPAFTPLEDSLFLTLCARALDNRSPHPILADAAADEIVRKLDYDYGQFNLNTNLVVTCAHRARKLDEVASRFIDDHPSAIGLDLGTGLDTRVVRIAPPATADWYDIDFPAVIAARERLIPRASNAHGVGADLTSTDWLDAIPTDRPAVVVADGLMAFLTLDEMASLVNRLVNHLPSGEIAFNSYTRFAIRAAKHSRGTKSVADLVKSAGFDDPHEPERWNPKLKLVKEILLCREPEVAEFPRTLRMYNRVLALNTRLSRKGTIVLHYRF